jgi:hypothetical protein
MFREHFRSEVSGWEAHTLLGPLENLNHQALVQWSTYQNVVFSSVFRIQNNRQCPETQ